MYDIENYYNAETIKEAVTLLKEHPDADVDELIRAALRSMN